MRHVSTREGLSLVFLKFSMRGIVVMALAAATIPGVHAANPAITEYRNVVSPILEKHCYECHGDGYDKGKVAFDALETDDQILQTDLWLRVLNNTRAGLMPAEKKPHLSPTEQAKLEHWIKYDVFQIDPANPDPGRVTVRRLNRVEYRNTVRDLIGVDYNTDHEFPPDDTGFGFDNIGDALTMSPMLMEKYVAAAQTIVAEAVPTAPNKPAEQTIKGWAFEGTNAKLKWNKRQLTFNDPANVSTTFNTALAGTYRVKLDLEINGTYTPDPGKARLIVKVDGQEVRSQELAYHDEKAFVVESTHQWQPSDHTVTIELQPTVPEGKKETITDLFVSKVRIEGPLEKSQWVKTENYDRYFPRAVPENTKQRRAYANELLTAFAQKA